MKTKICVSLSFVHRATVFFLQWNRYCLPIFRNSMYEITWCNPMRWQRFLSTESEMLLRRILVEERERFPRFLLENCRNIDKGSSWICSGFWSSSKSRKRTVVLRSIFTLGKTISTESMTLIPWFRPIGVDYISFFIVFNLRLNQYKQLLKPSPKK